MNTSNILRFKINLVINFLKNKEFFIIYREYKTILEPFRQWPNFLFDS
jgi:hypothetical protein